MPYQTASLARCPDAGVGIFAVDVKKNIKEKYFDREPWDPIVDVFGDREGFRKERRLEKDNNDGVFMEPRRFQRLCR